MRINSVSSNYTSPSFGRALGKEEAKEAYKTALEAREAMGFKDGRGILVIPENRLPDSNPSDTGVMDKIKGFFEDVRKFLGIDSIEVAGKSTPEIDEAIKDTGLKSYMPFTKPNDEKITLEEAVKEAAKQSDGIRIKDAQNFSEDELKTIEETFKDALEKRGGTYKPTSVIYDVTDDGALFDWGAETINGKFKGKTIVGSSNYINSDGGKLWGSTTFFTDRMKANQGEFVHGIRRPGQPSLIEQAYNQDQVGKSVSPLQSELSLENEDFVKSQERWMAAKRGDVAMSQNFYKNYDDLIPGVDAGILDFSEAYNKALLDGSGDNYFDSLAKAMKAKGLDETNSELYQNVVKFRNALASNLEGEAAYSDVSNVMLQGPAVRKQELQAIEEQRKAAQNAAKRRAKCDPLEDNFIHKIGKHIDSLNDKVGGKLGWIVGAAALLAAGGIIHSYNKEIKQKKEEVTPKAQERPNTNSTQNA